LAQLVTLPLLLKDNFKTYNLLVPRKALHISIASEPQLLRYPVSSVGFLSCSIFFGHMKYNAYANDCSIVIKLRAVTIKSILMLLNKQVKG